MKNIIKTVFCFGLFFIFNAKEAKALKGPYNIWIKEEIKIMPTAVVTKIIVINDIVENTEMKYVSLPSKTPTKMMIAQIMNTTTPDLTTEVKSSEPGTIRLEPTEVLNEETPINEMGTGLERPEGKKEKTNSDSWFWITILGLLALILAVQVWSTKKNEQSQTKIE